MLIEFNKYTRPKYMGSLAIVLIMLLLIGCFLFYLIGLANKRPPYANYPGDANERANMVKWIGKEPHRLYLNELINKDIIQSYPWVAQNPDGATGYNFAADLEARHNQSQLTARNYGDFAEITYVGNQL